MASKIVRENVDRLFDYDIDLDNRLIYMGSMNTDTEDQETGVDHTMAEKMIKALHILNAKSAKKITIIMNNPGGDWYHGMAIFDAIANSEAEVEIKVYGYAMSMGSVILQAADRRYMSANSKFMIHYGLEGHFGHSKIVAKWSDEGKRVNYDMENIYLEKLMEKDAEEGGDYLETALADILEKQKELDYPKPKREKIKLPTDKDRRKEAIRVYLKKLLDYDTILTAEETVKLGFADELL